MSARRSTLAPTSAAAEAEEARKAGVAALASHLAVAGELGVETAATDLSGLRDAVLEHGRDARNELQRIEDAIEQAQKLDQEIRAAREEHEVADLLGSRLRSDRFEKWLLVEALDALVRGGIDDAVRPLGRQLLVAFERRRRVRGRRPPQRRRDAIGAHALGRRDVPGVARARARAERPACRNCPATSDRKLEAIFLDEGFGTLDADTLETVASTIESLGTAPGDSNDTAGGRPNRRWSVSSPTFPRSPSGCPSATGCRDGHVGRRVEREEP